MGLVLLVFKSIFKAVEMSRCCRMGTDAWYVNVLVSSLYQAIDERHFVST
jgi:hypothetical protein